MNKDRRKRLNEIREQIENLAGELEEIQTEEQEYFDNMPESLQPGEKGDAAQAATDAIETAVDHLRDAASDIENAIA